MDHSIDDIIKFSKMNEFNQIIYRRKKKQFVQYQNIKSNKQIQTLITNSIKQQDNLSNFLKLLNKFLKIQNQFDFIQKLKHLQHKTDEHIIREFRKIAKTFLFKAEPIENKRKKYNRHSQIIFEHLQHILQNNVQSYLDVGCGDCIKTEIIGHKFNLKKSQIHGCDINSWGCY
mgnify:CR=1 FL=1